MTKIDKSEVKRAAKRPHQASVGKLNKMELLAVLLELHDVEYDKDVLENDGWVRPDYLRAVIHSISLEELDHPEDVEYTEELVEENAPTE